MCLDVTSQPWILSNIVDVDTGTAPEYLHPFQVIERCGVRIGIIGLVEEYVGQQRVGFPVTDPLSIETGLLLYHLGRLILSTKIWLRLD